MIDFYLSLFPASFPDAVALSLLGLWLAGVLVVVFPPWRKK